MPKRLSREGLRQVAIIAGGIVLEYGDKQTKWSKAARVPYATLARLRTALENAGYDMAAASARHKRRNVPADEKES